MLRVYANCPVESRISSAFLQASLLSGKLLELLSMAFLRLLTVQELLPRTAEPQDEYDGNGSEIEQKRTTSMKSHFKKEDFP